MEHIFIINPVSGKENPEKFVLPALEKYTSANPDFEYKVLYTEKVGHACEIARQYGEQGKPARLYAAGGDGTLNEIFEGSYKYPLLEVAALPCGTGNDFIRNYGTVADFLNLETQINGTPIAIDLVETDKNICASITSAGLDAEVAYGIPKFRRLPLFNGSMAYNASIVQRLFKKMGQQMEISIDGKIIEGNYLIVTICNGGFYGGGYNAAPNSKLDDGILEVILVKKMSRIHIPGVLAKYKVGRHFNGEEIDSSVSHLFAHHRGKEITVVPKSGDGFVLNVDGECGKAERLYAKVVPLAGRFVLPVPLYAAFKHS